MVQLIYTFRTFPLINKLNSVSDDVFVFGKLNEDFKRFTEIIIRQKPIHIIGIAKNSTTRIETLAVNKFNEKGNISLSGNDSYNLFLPSESPGQFAISTKPTTSFCNWTMYKVAEFIENNHLKSSLTFVHLAPIDIETFCNWLKIID